MAVICTVLDGPQADRRAEQGADDQHGPADRGDGALVDQQDQRGDDRDHHAGRGHLVAAPGGGRRVHQVQADDEAGRREHVDELDAVGESGHDRTLSRCSAAPAASAGWGAWGALDRRGCGLAAEHLQHPAGDHVAADHVRGGEERGHEREDVADGVVRGQADEQRAHQHDPVDRVGRRHQRRVQGRGHLADDLDADKQRQHEDGQVSYQRGRHRRLLRFARRDAAASPRPGARPGRRVRRRPRPGPRRPCR